MHIDISYAYMHIDIFYIHDIFWQDITKKDNINNYWRNMQERKVERTASVFEGIVPVGHVVGGCINTY